MTPQRLPLLPAPKPCECRTYAVRRGSYFRMSDRKTIQRYICRRCGRGFSEATSDVCFGQKKRQFNHTIHLLLTGGYSQRRAALDLKLNRKTIVRKFVFLGELALKVLPSLNMLRSKVKIMEFDDLETFEHSKCKPLSVILAVEHKVRWILDFRVAEMPSK